MMSIKLLQMFLHMSNVRISFIGNIIIGIIDIIPRILGAMVPEFLLNTTPTFPQQAEVASMLLKLFF